MLLQSMDWETRFQPKVMSIAMVYYCWRCLQEKKPTDSEFGEDFSLHTYVKMAVPDQVANIVDTYLLQEEDGNEGLTSDCDRTKDIRNACITSILRVGISCSKETPTDRVQIGDALKELQRIRDRFLRDSNQGAPGH